ncbi:MAG: serine hydrolase [Clostridia bacterium]|nr:serine hydrolase [Clostridia bacterium]
MNLNVINRLATHVTNFMDSKCATVPIIETLPQKPEIKITGIKNGFERVAPEEMGVSSETIRGYIEKIVADKSLNMHNIMILRGNKVIFECSFGGQDITVPKMTFSACKSITSIAIGMLIDEGKLSLSERAADIFEDRISVIDKLRTSDITVRDLLTMQTGIVFNEAESFASTNWLKSFFSSATNAKPGTEFSYNSLNTYILSAIVYKKSGKHLSEYLKERLFDPLGITDIAWEKCPMGVEKGGWGLYIRPEDMAKIGVLVLNGGVWDGKRLVSKEYLDDATTAHAKVPLDAGAFNYGYQIWVGRETDTFLFNGMLGQNVLCFKNNGITIVSNAGNGELFQQSNYYDITLTTFSKIFPEKIPQDKIEQMKLARLKKTLAFGGGKTRLASKAKIFASLEKLFYGSFDTDDADAPSFGLMPAILQVSQNNYTKGTKHINFALDKEACAVNITFEENDETHNFRAGLMSGEKTELYFHGEKFTVCAFARYAQDEDMRPVLVVRIDFIETPCSRIMKFFFEDNEMICVAEEDPGAGFVAKCANDILGEALDNKFVALIASKMDKDYFTYKFEKIMAPHIHFIRKAVISTE